MATWHGQPKLLARPAACGKDALMARNTIRRAADDIRHMTYDIRHRTYNTAYLFGGCHCA
jgi:hypothetical protein